MIEQKQQKKQVYIDLKKITPFFEEIKKYMVGVYQFFKDNKNNSKMMLFVAILTFGIAIYFGIQLYSDISHLQ